MRNGYWVACGFAAGWAIAGLYASGWPPITWLLPLALSAALLAWAYRVPGTARPISPQGRTQIRRWSLVEGIAIVVAMQLLHRFHHPDAVFPVVAIIVGLHFLPLASALSARLYYATAIGLVIAGGIGMLLTPPDRPLAVGLAAAAILWITALYRILEARTERRLAAG